MSTCPEELQRDIWSTRELEVSLLKHLKVLLFTRLSVLLYLCIGFGDGSTKPPDLQRLHVQQRQGLRLKQLIHGSFPWIWISLASPLCTLSTSVCFVGLANLQTGVMLAQSV